MDETPIAVLVENLAKRYNGRSAHDALKDIHLTIPVGQVCCLLGPNGSGKTTFLKILAGLLTPTQGSVSIMGLDANKHPLEARAKVGWMPAEERSGFYGRLTGRQNLEFFAGLHRVPRADVDRMVGNLGLLLDITDDLDTVMLKMSAGGKQKVGLARSLLHNPSVLLLDEPLRNLDPHTVIRFRRLLKDHLTRLQNKTIVLSTHQLDEATRIADILVILHKGQMIKTITRRELEKDLKNTSVEELYLKIVDEVKK